MTDLEGLIENLSAGLRPVRPMRAPRRLALELSAVLGVYALAVVAVLGLRSDLAMQLHRPWFAAEIFLLLFITLSSVGAAVCLATPDEYQRPEIKLLPLIGLLLFVLLVDVQVMLPLDPRMVIPGGAAANTMECTLCIAAVAIAPAALMLVLLGKGASARPLLAGAWAVLAAAGVGCLTLRLAEMNDSLSHLVQWHYLPTLGFAALGGLAGRLFLKW